MHFSRMKGTCLRLKTFQSSNCCRQTRAALVRRPSGRLPGCGTDVMQNGPLSPEHSVPRPV